MNNQIKSASFLPHSVPLWILGSALVISIFTLIVVMQFDATRLALFGPTAKIYLTAIQNGLMSAVSILALAFVSFLFFKKEIEKVRVQFTNFYFSLSNKKQNTLVLVLCMLFVFASNAENIIHGYFNMDDIFRIACEDKQHA